jgi:hypothetical protein
MSLKIVEISDGYSSSAVPSVGTPSSTASFTYTITLTDVINKYLTLPGAPNVPSSAELVWLGVGQVYGVDFIVSSNTMNWNGLGLESLILTGDKVFIYYQ